mgnify:CR=1 FL=1
MTISIPLLRIVVEPAFWMILMIVPAVYLCGLVSLARWQRNGIATR